MAFLLGDCSCAIHELEGCPEVREGVGLNEMMFLDDLPSGDLRLHLLQLCAFQGRHAAAAGNTVFVGQRHGFSPSILCNARHPKWYRKPMSAQTLIPVEE